MRIAFSCDDDRGLEGVVAHHFGRCPYYTFVEMDDGQVKRVEVTPNPYYGQHAPGVVPAFINSRGADVMITGGMGARAVAFSSSTASRSSPALAAAYAMRWNST